jgi:hypothetical protein
MSLRTVLTATLAAAGLAASANAQTFGFDSIVALRVGGDASFNGAASIGNTATSTFLDFFSTAGVRSSTLSTGLTDSGTATSNGFISVSTDRTTVLVPGYLASAGTSGVANSAPGTINRGIGRLVADNSGTPVYINDTGFNNGPSANFRNVVSDTGNRYWAATQGSASAQGIGYSGSVGSITAATSIANGNQRNLGIFGGRLFGASGSASPGVGIADFGLLSAATSGPITPTILPGTNLSGTGTPSPYAFALLDNPLNTNSYNGTGLDTLYIADDRTTANGGGLQRWVFDGSTWILNATLANPNTSGKASGNFRGLDFRVETDGTITFIVTTAGITSGAQGNAILTFTDTLTASGGTFSAVSTVVSSPDNTFLRSAAFIPTPGAASLLALGGLVAARRRRN